MDNIFINIAGLIRDFIAGFGLSDGLVYLAMVLVKFVAVLVFVLLNVIFLVYMERRVAGFFQERLGPNRVGPQGIFQLVMDILKLLSKEDIVPASADKFVYKAAAFAIFVPTMMVYMVIPFGKGMNVIDLNMGLFYILAVSSITTLIIFMAGWGSKNKYSLIGGMRAVAQMVSYEIPFVFSFLGVIMIAGSLNLSTIVEAQQSVWFIVLQPIAFIIFLIAGNAEINRGPFDLPEGEQELVAGYHTEYTAGRFAMFYMAEYANLLAMSAIGATVFLGGWHGPWLPGWLWFFIKMYVLVFGQMWVRWTFPRIRIDQMMHFNWKVLLPISIANILVTGIGIKAYEMFRVMGWW
ncbi:MAG: NADH-quinone oxidoreductase subunit NuoH [Bacillota bacterium]|jgi:NADH-quinone oxidoreductase subunit H